MCILATLSTTSLSTLAERPRHVACLIAWNAKFGRFAVPNLTVILIAGQVLLYRGRTRASRPGGGVDTATASGLMPDKVLQGEWWRLITFLFDPPTTNRYLRVLLLVLVLSVGHDARSHWGTFRYNVFLADRLRRVGRDGVRRCGSRLGVPGQIAASNGFLYGTVFLAFARLYPDFVMYIFFILPVKINWLALLQWIVLRRRRCCSATWMVRAMVVGVGAQLSCCSLAATSGAT